MKKIVRPISEQTKWVTLWETDELVEVDNVNYTVFAIIEIVRGKTIEIHLKSCK